MLNKEKIHLNLSEQAFYILMSDSWSFMPAEFDHQKKRPGDAIINRIFCNFCKNSLAGRLFSHPEAATRDSVPEQYLYVRDKDPKLQFSITLRAETVKCLSAYIVLNLKGMGGAARVAKREAVLSQYDESVRKLYSDVSCTDPDETTYDVLMPNRGKFIKAVLEEYAACPYYKREEIFYEHIRAEIFRREKPNLLPLVTFLHQNGQMKCLYPYQLLRDEWSMHNYLIGLDEKGKVCNYRISNLKEIRSVDERAGRVFTKEELAAIKTAISQKGVMFVAEKLASVRLVLTEAGMRLYNGTTFMRPKYKRIERRDDGRYILEFECTPRQIEYYFFKFGESVELLQPSYLRAKFREKYKNAYENHCASQEM